MVQEVFKDKVASNLVTLPTIDHPLTESAYDELFGMAQDFVWYNGRYYKFYGGDYSYDGTHNACVLQTHGECQVLRFFAVDVYMSDSCLREYYDNEIEHEDEDDWMDDTEYGEEELEIQGVHEYKRVWITKNGQVIETRLGETFCEDAECFVKVDSLQDWAYEPRIRNIILDYVNEYTDYCYTSRDELALAFALSQSAEYLHRNEPIFYKVVVDNGLWEEAIERYKTFRVAHRHGWQFPTNYADASLYFKYLDLLEMEGEIYLTQPEHICPSNLAEVYARADARRKELLEQAEKRKAQAREEFFKAQHSWLFGIEFDSEHLHFKSLDSVEAYRIEGEIMHHCIYKCAYYEKPYFLAMHITDHEGNRVATCTVDLLRRVIDQIQPICDDTGFFHTYGIEWKTTADYLEIHKALTDRMASFPSKETHYNNQLKVA